MAGRVASEVCAIDASVGVKWFRNESGSDQAKRLLRRHIEGEVLIAVDALFYYEVIRAASRTGGPRDAERVWRDLRDFELAMVPLGDELVSAACDSAQQLGCTLYDAFASGLADLLEAPLYSAHARAHGAHPRVRLVGAEAS
jgi:predicted nucleic acid-binding protein